MVSISKLPVLVAISGRPNEEICTESDNANLSSDVNPTTYVEEMDSDD